MKTASKEKYLRVFLITFAACMLALLPILIIGGGRFFYYGDYNKQQIVFSSHLAELVRSGELSSWDWFADLGSDTASAYSFYLLGSPFFWLMTVFPAKLAVTLLPVFIAIKSGIAALGAYGYIRLFCKNQNASLIGAVLFGLSAYNTANLIFNHFHDAVLMLPFMLWALELLIQKGRHGFFALTVALAAFTSYYFFFGQVIFIILYFIVGVLTGHFRLRAGRFAALVFESIAGTLLAAVLLLPAFMSVKNNPRVTDFLSGSGFFVYESGSVYFAILRNMFLLPDITLLGNFGSDSIKALQTSYHSSYIHFFSLCGVIAYFRSVKGREHFKVLIAVCGGMMLIPVLNQSFSFFNGQFYGRWFYMPVLIACVMTAKAVEQHAEDGASLKKGFVPTAVITGIVAAAALAVTVLSKYEVIELGFANYSYAYVQIVFGITAMGFLWLALYRPSSSEAGAVIKSLTVRTVVFCTAGLCIVVWCSYIFRGTSESYIMKSAFDYRDSGETLADTDKSFYRVSSDANYQNLPILWGCRTVRYFNSTVEPTVTEFYNGLGMERTVKSDFEITDYPLAALLSVKYYIDEAYFDDNGDAVPPAEYVSGTDDTYRILYQKQDINFYENTEYIPMGFAYDSFTTNKALEGQPSLMKEYAYLEALVLDESQAEEYSDILEEYDLSALSTAKDRYKETAAGLRAKSCSVFEQEGSGFRAEIGLEKASLVFFSIPYSEGWSAEVNGEAAKIEKVDNGLMAVKCEAGRSEIRFSYENGYMRIGLITTVSSAVLLGGYLALMFRFRAKKGNRSAQ